MNTNKIYKQKKNNLSSVRIEPRIIIALATVVENNNGMHDMCESQSMDNLFQHSYYYFIVVLSVCMC